MKRLACLTAGLIFGGLLLTACKREHNEGPAPKTPTPKAAKTPAAAVANSVGMKLRYIPPGEFVMGSREDEKGREDDEAPRHTVKLTKGFYLGATEVTQAQWAAVMETQPWAKNKNFSQGEKYPAVYISWDDARAFCQKLSAREGRVYRLPTEAEWEYACRAGTDTQFYWGVEYQDGYAWSSKNAKRMHPVGELKPNAWGLYDMGGNVWEWVADWHGPYPADAATDPQGPPTGEARVIRSGSYGNSSYDTRPAERGATKPENKISGGLRVVMDLDKRNDQE